MKTRLTIITASLLLAGAAIAEPIKDRGGYVGLAYGMTSLDDDSMSDDYLWTEWGLRGDLDDSGQAWQVYGGYRFSKYFAVEGRYTDFGDYTSEANYDAELTAGYSILSAHALGILPFGESGFDIYGQLGAGLISYEGEFDTPYWNVDESDDAATFSLGAGVRYTPPRLQAMTVQLAYDVYVFQTEVEYGWYGDETETYDQSLSMVKLGVQYNF